MQAAVTLTSADLVYVSAEAVEEISRYAERVVADKSPSAMYLDLNISLL